MRRRTTGGETSKRYVNHRLTAAYLEADDDDDDEYDDARGRRASAAAEVCIHAWICFRRVVKCYYILFFSQHDACAHVLCC